MQCILFFNMFFLILPYILLFSVIKYHLHSRPGTRMQMHFIFLIFFPKHTFDFSLLLNITYILGKEQGCKAFHFSDCFLDHTFYLFLLLNITCILGKEQRCKAFHFYDLFFKSYILPFIVIEHQLHSRQGTRIQSSSFF